MTITKRTITRIRNVSEDLFFNYFSYTIRRQVASEELRIYINDRFAKNWYSYQSNWTELRLIKENLLTPHAIVADCGANIGFTSVFFSKQAKNGKVYAFEALPKNAQAIHKNIALNKCDNVEVVNKGVGSHSGVLHFSTFGNGAVASGSKKNTVAVDVVTLDSFFAEKKKPDFLKIDVEGFEYEVLTGAAGILALHPKIALEMHVFTYADKRRQSQALLSLLESNGYGKGMVQYGYEGSVERLENGFDLDRIVQSQLVHFYLY